MRQAHALGRRSQLSGPQPSTRDEGGDLVLFHHSNADPPGVAGVARVCREAYPDADQFNPDSDYYDPKSSPDDPRWSMVDVEFDEAMPAFVSLEALEADEKLDGMLVRKRGMRPVGATRRARPLQAGAAAR